MKNLIIIAALCFGGSIARADLVAPEDPIVSDPIVVDPTLDETTAPADAGGSDWITDGTLTDGASAKSGDVLYHVVWEGHGPGPWSTYYWNKEYKKVKSACAEAGGELKNMKTWVEGLYDYGEADCVKT